MNFAIKRFGHDIISACRHLGIKVQDVVVSGSSLGATSLLEAMKEEHFRPRGAFLIGPNTEFKGPWFAKLLLLLHPGAYHLVKYFIIWYLRHFRVDAKQEPEQIGRYEKTLLEADPYRLKLTLKAILDYQVWPDLEKITVPVCIAYASSDTLHVEDNIQRLSTSLQQAELLECESNREMHSAPLASDLENFISRLPEK